MARNKLISKLTSEELRQLNAQTISHYQRSAYEFAEATEQHDVSQNIEALLRNMKGVGPYNILDLGCGPGRDLLTFKTGKTIRFPTPIAAIITGPGMITYKLVFIINSKVLTVQGRFSRSTKCLMPVFKDLFSFIVNFPETHNKLAQ